MPKKLQHHHIQGDGGMNTRWPRIIQAAGGELEDGLSLDGSRSIRMLFFEQ
jgi:hypothetical protein